MVCGSMRLPARLLGNRHGVAAVPPAVRRLGRLARCSQISEANGSGTGLVPFPG